MKVLIVPEDPTHDALHRREIDASWREIRSECDPKERFAEPFLASKGWDRLLGGGRKRAMRELGNGWKGLLAICEELVELDEKIGAWLAARP